MNASTFENGIFTIKNQILKIDNKSINLANVDTLLTFDYKRHPLFANVKEWLVGLVITFIIGLIWKNLDFIFTIYIFTIILLLVYNFKEHQKAFYGLKIRTSVTTIYLKSNDKGFIEEILATIEDAINSKKANYTINLDNRLINNGVISKGNKNTNKVNVNHDNE